ANGAGEQASGGDAAGAGAGDDRGDIAEEIDESTRIAGEGPSGGEALTVLAAELERFGQLFEVFAGVAQLASVEVAGAEIVEGDGLLVLAGDGDQRGHLAESEQVDGPAARLEHV